MKKTTKPVLLAGLLIAGVSVASATVLVPGVAQDFESFATNTDNPYGWRIASDSVVADEVIQPHVVSEGGRKFLRYESQPTKNASNKRIAFYNKSLDGDYTGFSAITADFKASSDSVGSLFLRLNFEGDDGEYYSSKDSFELATNNVWQTVSFGLTAGDFYIQGQERRDKPQQGEKYSAVDEAVFAEAILHIHEFKIVSNEEYAQWSGVDKVKATVGMDNFTAVSQVPVPAAAWLMVTGLLGLGGISSRRKAVA